MHGIGLDKKTAQKILKVWEGSGASSPDELRKLLVKRSVQSVGAVLVQTVLDAGAMLGSLVFAHLVGRHQNQSKVWHTNRIIFVVDDCAAVSQHLHEHEGLKDLNSPPYA
jgi:uncharacterized protein (UPF0218 family)